MKGATREFQAHEAPRRVMLMTQGDASDLPGVGNLGQRGLALC